MAVALAVIISSAKVSGMVDSVAGLAVATAAVSEAAMVVAVVMVVAVAMVVAVELTPIVALRQTVKSIRQKRGIKIYETDD